MLAGAASQLRYDIQFRDRSCGSNDIEKSLAISVMMLRWPRAQKNVSIRAAHVCMMSAASHVSRMNAGCKARTKRAQAGTDASSAISPLDLIIKERYPRLAL